jgi:hypothetical protein
MPRNERYSPCPLSPISTRRPAGAADRALNYGALGGVLARRAAGAVGQHQEPFNKIVGNFPVGASLPGGGPKKPEPVAVRPGRYILFGSSAVPIRATPGEKPDNINLTLDVPTEVQVFEFVGDWTLIGRGNTKLGYVPAKAVYRMKE